MEFPHLETSLTRLLATLSPATAAIIERAVRGDDLSIDDATHLFDCEGSELLALTAAADYLRAQTVGDVVTYVVNRNINFTNVCVKACRFCAFSRTQRSEEAYFLGPDEVVRRAVEARDLGATEVCIQAGHAAGGGGRTYVELCRAVKLAAPELHIPAFSPEEIKYGAKVDGVPI